MPKPQRGRSPQPASPYLVRTSDPSSPPRGSFSQRRPNYPDAVAGYERGMRALQEHRYGDAAEAFRGVLAKFPEEKELNDRVRLYLALCERQLNAAPEPTTLEERLYAATLALNAGDRSTALRHLEAVVAEEPDHDGALYMMSVAHAMSDDRERALAYLQRAIRQNPANRALALQDGDLERLMQDASARAAVEAMMGGRAADVRTPQRHRPIR